MSTVEGRVVTAVRDGMCVDLTGRPASGRSRLLRRLGSLLAEEGVRTLRLAGVPALSDRPLSGFLVVEPQEAAPPTGNLTDLVSHLRSWCAEGRRAVLVDDADALDEISTGVLTSVHRATGVPVVTVRAPGPAADRTRVLRDGLQPGITVAVPPLTFEGVHQLVHDILPRTPGPTLVARIATLSGGLPGLVRALVDLAAREERVADQRGLLELAGEPWAPGLEHALTPFLRGLAPDELAALTTLALAGTRPLRSAQRLADPALLDSLEQRGLLEVLDQPGAPEVSVFPPLLAEHLVRSCPPVRRELTHAQVLEATAGGPGTGAPAPVGMPAPGVDALVSARIAQHWAARRHELRARWEQDRSAATGLALLEAVLTGPDDLELFDRVAAGTVTEPGSVEAVEIAGLVALRRARRGGGAGAARAVLAAAAPSSGAAGLAADLAGDYIELLVDRVPAERAVDPELLGTPLDGVARLIAAESRLVQGRTSAALGQLTAGLPVPSLLVRHTGNLVDLARILDGQVSAGVAGALDGLARARAELDPGPLGAYAYTAALGLALAGRFTELESVVSSTLTVTTTSQLEADFRAGLIAVASVAADWQGRHAYGRRLANQSRAVGVRAGPFPAMLPADVLGAGRTDQDAGDLIWGAALDRLERGYVAAGVFAAVEALDHDPRPDRAGVLADASSGVGGVLLPALVSYGVALAARDAEQLRSARDALAAAGAHAYATRAAVAAAVALRGEGRTAAATRELDGAWRAAAPLGAGRRGFFAAYVRLLDLTEREFDVLGLLAAGVSTADTSRALSLSVRTVENYVQSIYRKTGVNTREDLDRVQSTWLTEPEG